MIFCFLKNGVELWFVCFLKFSLVIEGKEQRIKKNITKINTNEIASEM